MGVRSPPKTLFSPPKTLSTSFLTKMKHNQPTVGQKEQISRGIRWKHDVKFGLQGGRISFPYLVLEIVAKLQSQLKCLSKDRLLFESIKI